MSDATVAESTPTTTQKGTQGVTLLTLAMMVVGRLVGKVDTRLLVLTGLGLMAWSLRAMTHWNAEVGVSEIISTGIVQGIGLGFIFVPLSTIAFSTLAPRYRNEGTAMFSLIRNIGASVGISARLASSISL